MAMNDQSEYISWEPGCSGAPGSCTFIDGTTSPINGFENSTQVYNALVPPLDPTTFAVGLCVNVSIDGYTNWYLPAMCELGYNTDDLTSPCGDQDEPT